MDLSFSAEESAFAEEIRAWLDANLELPPRFATLADEVEWGRAWQAQLAAGRWVGIHWPEAYGGRGASRSVSSIGPAGKFSPSTRIQSALRPAK